MRKAVIDLLGLLGLGAAINGVRLVYPPAAWIVGGVLLMAGAMMATAAARAAK